MLDREVGKDQRANGSDRLWLADHIPRRCEPSKLPGKTLLQEAVVSARRTRGKDRITSSELQRETAPVEDAFCQQAEAWTPRQEGHELAEGPTVEAGIAKQRKRSGEFHHNVGFPRTPGGRADQAPAPRLADQHARVSPPPPPYD